MWIEVEGLNFNVYLVLIILRWRIAKIQTDLLQRRLQMFVLAISKPISKAVGIHQHSNNVPWHPKAICNISERDKKKNKKTQASAVFSFILFSDWASGVSFWGDSKTNKTMRAPEFQQVFERAAPLFLYNSLPTMLCVVITLHTSYFTY